MYFGDGFEQITQRDAGTEVNDLPAPPYQKEAGKQNTHVVGFVGCTAHDNRLAGGNGLENVNQAGEFAAHKLSGKMLRSDVDFATVPAFADFDHDGLD